MILGYVKDQMIRDQERGYSSAGDKHVCPDCFIDEGVQAFVKEHAVSSQCDYCGKNGGSDVIAAPIDEVVGHIVASLETEYDMPEDELPTEFMKDGIGTIDTYDLLWNPPIVDPCDGPLWDDILAAITSQRSWWCKRDYFGLQEDEVLLTTWRGFVELVNHRVRYVFFRTKTEDAENYWDKICDPLRALDAIAKTVDEIGLVRKLDAGTILFRVRLDKTKTFTAFDDIGTPQSIQARYSNRMSPAGVAMFYAASNKDVAIAETWRPSTNAKASIGEFVTKKQSLILDLSRLPHVPSIYDAVRRHLRAPLKFMWLFMRDFAKPVKKDGREHIEYVPTQIVTEFFRHVYRTEDDKRIDGICYPSSLSQEGCSYVFFWGHDDDKYLNPELLSDWCDLVSVRHETLKKSVEIMKKRAAVNPNAYM